MYDSCLLPVTKIFRAPTAYGASGDRTRLTMNVTKKSGAMIAFPHVSGTFHKPLSVNIAVYICCNWLAR